MDKLDSMEIDNPSDGQKSQPLPPTEKLYKPPITWQYFYFCFI
jgi:hypothetical protein